MHENRNCPECRVPLAEDDQDHCPVCLAVLTTHARQANCSTEREVAGTNGTRPFANLPSSDDGPESAMAVTETTPFGALSNGDVHATDLPVGNEPSIAIPSSPFGRPTAFTPPTDATIQPAPPHNEMLRSSADKAGEPLEKSVDDLPRVHLRPNWPQEKGALPQFLLRGRGRQLEVIVQHFVAAVDRSTRNDIHVAVAAELANSPDVNRPLRIVNTMAPGHRTSADVVFRAEGEDLYVRFEGRPRTPISYLRRAFGFFVYAAAFTIPFLIYLFCSGAFEGWLMDFSQKHGAQTHPGASDGGTVLYRKLHDGYQVLDAQRFRQRFQEAGGDAFIDESIGEIGLSIGTGGMTTPTDWDGVDESLLTLWGDVMPLATVRQLLVFARADAFPVLAAQGAQQQFNPDGFHVWQDSSRKLMGGDGQSPPLFAVDQIDFVPRAANDSLAAYMGAADDSKLGRIIGQCYDESVHSVPPINAIQLFLADPKICAWNIGIPVSVIAGIAGFSVWLVPDSVLRYPCRWIGWPTPDEFGNMVQGHNAWTERVLSDVLLHDFEIQEGDKFQVH